MPALTVTNRDIRTMFSALSVLSARTLPSLKSDLKVAKLLREHIRGPFMDTETAREKLIAAMPAPEGATDEGLPAALKEARNNRFRDEVLAQTIPLDIPDRLLITEDDLPKAMKGEQGEANRSGLADILTGLGPLYVMPADEESGA